MTNDKQLQIDKLNREVKVYLAPSKIHGVGIFAMRDLTAGEKLYADAVPTVYTLTASDLGKVRPEIKEMLLGQWPQIVNGSRFAYPTTRIQAYCNHSDKANYDAQNDVTLRAIKEGKEITENYRAIPGYQHVFPWLAIDKQ